MAPKSGGGVMVHHHAYHVSDDAHSLHHGGDLLTSYIR